MASNKRQLQQDKKHLTKAKAPSKPKDVLYTEEGQWKFPGQVTKVPTPTGSITMAGVNQPLYGVDNTGFAQMMYPENEYQFPGDVVTEYPQEAKRGGTAYKLTKPSKKGINSKAYSRSLMATNRLFLENPLFKKPKSKRNKIFDPKAKYYEDGGEQDDYVYIDNLSPDEIEEYAQGGYVVEDLSIPSLTKAQKGGGLFKRKKKQEEQEQLEYRPPVEVDDEMYESVTPFPEAPEDFKEGVGNIKEVKATRQAPDWLKFSNEYEKKNSKQAFIDEKKRNFLKQNKGLNAAAGVTMDYFPEDVEKNFEKAYEYKKNSFIVKKLGKTEKFSPNRRGEWVDELSEKEKEILANSKYENKLQPSYWSRSLAGAQELGNEIIKLLPGTQGDVMKANIPGLTKKEQKEIADSKLGALETFAAGDIPGAVIANAINRTGNISTGGGYRESPGIFSGEKMSGVTDDIATVLNPATYAGLVELPLAARTLATKAPSLLKAAKTLLKPNLIDETGKVIKTGAEVLKDIDKAAGDLPNELVARRLDEFTNVNPRKRKIGSQKELATTLKKDAYKFRKLQKQNPDIDLNDPRIKGYEYAEDLDKVPEMIKGMNQNEKSAKKFGKYFEKQYGKKVETINEHPIFKKIIEESPQYTDEIYEHLKNGKQSDADFLNDLTVQSNTYARFTNNPVSTGELRGRSMGREGYTMDVEGIEPSDYYGAHGYKIEPNLDRLREIINAPIEEKWAKRIPKFDSDITLHSDGMHTTFHPDIQNFRTVRNQRVNTRLGNKYGISAEPSQIGMENTALRQLESVLPQDLLNSKYSRIPKHLVFESPEFGTMLENFDIRPLQELEKIGNEMGRLVDRYNYGKFFKGTGKGFAQGGIVSELSKKEIKDLVAQGYIVEEVD